MPIKLFELQCRNFDFFAVSDPKNDPSDPKVDHSDPKINTHLASPYASVYAKFQIDSSKTLQVMLWKLKLTSVTLMTSTINVMIQK